jgi:3D (Asp-Asp-Asp) domain-containing protein
MKKHFLLFSFVCSLVHPLVAIAAEAQGPREQDFIITAYYSPEPDQCCYVKGSYAADVVLNGEGTHGADGTEVMPGMAAAPKTYAFGTTIVLPGIGTVRVHDRGGAINELPDGPHRLDLWVGKGEEGLARALAFGVQRALRNGPRSGQQQSDERRGRPREDPADGYGSGRRRALPKAHGVWTKISTKIIKKSSKYMKLP